MILNEIINCCYRNIVKRIYLEGKILELLAVYMDELIFENGGVNSLVKLTSSDGYENENNINIQIVKGGIL